MSQSGNEMNVFCCDALVFLIIAPRSIWKFYTNQDNVLQYTIAPQYVGSISIDQLGGSICHNVFVEQNRLWAAYYSSGTAVWDISEPARPVLVGHYNHSDFGHGFNGTTS
jgi:hypothetical protein